MNNELKIPKISDERIVELLEIIRPLIFVNEDLWHITIPSVDDCRGTSFIWGTNTTIKANNLKPVRSIRTLHTYGYYGFFKPSIAEILAQLPGDIEGIVAFSVEGFTSVEYLNKEIGALNAGFHVGETTLYTRISTVGR